MDHCDEKTDLDRLVTDLQKEIDEQDRALYSAKVIEETRHPRNFRRMANADVRGLVHGWCGDTMEVYLRLEEDRIIETTFATDGCGPTLACGSMLTSMVQGLSLEEASRIVPKDLLSALDGLPEESQHCAELAVRTLHNAIFNWQTRHIVQKGPKPRDRTRRRVAAQAGQLLAQGYH